MYLMIILKDTKNHGSLFPLKTHLQKPQGDEVEPQLFPGQDYEKIFSFLYYLNTKFPLLLVSALFFLTF